MVSPLTADHSAGQSAATLAGIRERGYRNGATGAECARLSDSAAVDIPLLLAAIEALTGALERHQQWFTDSKGVRLCGGCLEPAPCKDDPERFITAALSGTGKEGSEAG